MKSAYQPLVTGLRCHDDSRMVVLGTGRVGHVTYPHEEFLKYRTYTLDVYEGTGPGTPGLSFVVRRHWGRDGLTPPYVVSAERLPHDILTSDWTERYNPWRPVLERTDARGEAQASVRVARDR